MPQSLSATKKPEEPFYLNPRASLATGYTIYAIIRPNI